VAGKVWLKLGARMIACVAGTVAGCVLAVLAIRGIFELVQLVRARLFLLALAALAGLTPGLDAGNYGYRYGTYGYSYPSYSYGYSYPSYSYYPYSYSYYPAGTYAAGYYNGTYYNGGYYPASVVYGTGYSASTYTAPAAASYSADWKSELLKVQKLRDEHAAYLQATKGLGFSLPLQSPYGGVPVLPPAPPVNSYAHPNLGAYGVNGATTYGMTVAQTQSAYGQQTPLWAVDLMQLYQAQSRALERAQDTGKEAYQQFSSNVALTAQSAAAIAEITTKAQALAQIAQTLTPSPSSVTTTTTTASGSGLGRQGAAPYPGGPASQPPGADAPAGPPPGAQAAPRTPNEVILNVFRTAAGKCTKCHAGADPKGKFLVERYPGLGAPEQNKVLRRLFSENPEKQMPPPGEPQLTTEELMSFVGLRK